MSAITTAALSTINNNNNNDDDDDDDDDDIIHDKNQCLARGESLSKHLSFCGCGFLGLYHCGVSACMNQFAPHLSTKKIAGSSVGALVAVAHICGDLQITHCINDIMQTAMKARAKPLGPFHPSFNINELIYTALRDGLPENIHKLASGLLHVSLTRVDDGENVVISEYDSKDDVIKVLICSCFIPLWSGFVPPKYKGVAYMDGGFSNNLLKFDDKSTITVSPFSGEADICPIDDYANLFQISLSNTSFSLTPGNMYRILSSLLPPTEEALNKLYDQGYNDALRYLREQKHLPCVACLSQPVPWKLSDCQQLSAMRTASSNESSLETLQVYEKSYSNIVEEVKVLEMRQTITFSVFMADLAQYFCTKLKIPEYFVNIL